MLVDVGVTLMRWGLQEHPDGTVDRELLVWIGRKPEMWTSQWNAVEYRLAIGGRIWWVLPTDPWLLLCHSLLGTLALSFLSPGFSSALSLLCPVCPAQF